VEHNRVIGCERELLEVLHKLPHTSRRKGLLMLKALQETDHTQLFGKRGDALDTLDQFVLGGDAQNSDKAALSRYLT
jgi:hypothetical protein